MAKKKEAKEKLEEYHVLARVYFDKFPNPSIIRRIERMIEGYDDGADVGMHSCSDDVWLSAHMNIIIEPSRIHAIVDALKDDMRRCLADYPGKYGACIKLFCCFQPHIIGDYKY